MNKKYLIMWFSLVFCLSVFLDSFVVWNLWKWYIVPLGVCDISLKEALGLRVFSGFITYHYYNFKKEENNLIDALSYLFYRPILVLFLGWLINLL